MNSNGSVNKELHMFPFGIECENGKEIDIETYFKPTIRKDNKTDTITGSFRGRSLNGLEVHLPPGYVDTITGSFRGRSLNGHEVHLPSGYGLK
ncbi:hypothetical protein GJ496_007776 [Pomphorhynchus laevis]|nr:hypothetical protein GJ496_007776 [Pomphorhynchus laevis]